MTNVIKSIEIVSSTHNEIDPQTFEGRNAVASFNVMLCELDPQLVEGTYEKTDVVIHMNSPKGKAMTYSFRFDVGCDVPDILCRVLEGIDDNISMLPLCRYSPAKLKAELATAELFKILFELAKLEVSRDTLAFIMGEVA